MKRPTMTQTDLDRERAWADARTAAEDWLLAEVGGDSTATKNALKAAAKAKIDAAKAKGPKPKKAK